MEKTKTSMWNAAFLKILAVQFCMQMGQQMMNTLVPKYANALGATASVVGLVSSIFSIASTLILLVATPAFDCYSRKKMLMLSIAGLTITFIGYGISTSVPALFAFRILHGFSQGCSSTLTLVMVSDTLSSENMGRGIGIFTLCQAVGQAVGPSFGLSLSTSIGYSWTFFLGASAIFLAFVLASRIQDIPRPTKPYKIAFDRIIDREAIHPAVLIMALQGPYCCVSSFIAIYGALRGVENIGLYFTVYAICLLVTRPLSGSLIDKIGHEIVLIAGIVCFGLSFYIISIAHSLTPFLIASAVSAFGYGICQPTLSYMSMSCAPVERRGAASSTNNIGMSIGFFLGVTAAGYVVDWLNARMGSEVEAYSRMYVVMIVPMAFALVYFLATRKRIRNSIQNAREN